MKLQTEAPVLETNNLNLSICNCATQAQPYPNSTQTLPCLALTLIMGDRVCTNMQLLSLISLISLVSSTQVSHLLKQPYIYANSTQIFMKL